MRAMMICIALFSLALATCMPVIAQSAPFSISEKTVYGITENTVYLTFTDTSDKAQTVANVTFAFADSGRTRTIDVTGYNMLQNVTKDVYGYSAVSIGKYSTSSDDCKTVNATQTCVTVYKTSSRDAMKCDYVLGDKSCMVKKYGVIRQDVVLEFASLPAVKQKIVTSGQKVEQKVAGTIPLAKGGIVQIRVVMPHPISYNIAVPAWENKYNITACSQYGCSELDPTWWNDTWTKYANVSVTEPNMVARTDGEDVLEFTFNASSASIVNCTNVLRVVNETGNEMKCVAWNDRISGSNRYCDVVCPEFKIGQNAVRNLSVYYGNATPVVYPDYAGSVTLSGSETLWSVSPKADITFNTSGSQIQNMTSSSDIFTQVKNGGNKGIYSYNVSGVVSSDTVGQCNVTFQSSLFTALNCSPNVQGGMLFKFYSNSNFTEAKGWGSVLYTVYNQLDTNGALNSYGCVRYNDTSGSTQEKNNDLNYYDISKWSYMVSANNGCDNIPTTRGAGIIYKGIINGQIVTNLNANVRPHVNLGIYQDTNLIGDEFMMGAFPFVNASSGGTDTAIKAESVKHSSPLLIGYGTEQSQAAPPQAPTYSNEIAIPASASEYSDGQTLGFYITWNWVASKDNVTFRSNFTGAFANYTVNINGNVTHVNFTQSQFKGVGGYQYLWYATNGTYVTTSTYDYILNKKTVAAPHLAINGTESSQTFTYPASHNATAWSDTAGGVSLLRNGTNVTNSDTGQYPAGSWNYTATFVSQNYTSGQTERMLTISKASNYLTLTLNGTNGNYASNDGNGVFVATAPALANATLSIYYNGDLLGSDVSPYTKEKGNMPIGTNTIIANWTGNANYSADSESWTFTAKGINITEVIVSDTGAPLTANITIYDTTHSFTAKDVSWLANYSTQLWGTATTIKVQSSGYADRYFSSTQPEAKSISAAMLPSGSGAYIRFYVLSAGGVAISGATVEAKQFVDEAWTTIETKTTDDSGIARIFLDPLISYQMTASATGYISKTNTIMPAAEDYFFYLSSTTNTTFHTLFETVELGLTPRYPALDKDHNYTFNYDVTDTNSSIGWFSMRIRYNGTTEFFKNVSNLPQGGNITYTVYANHSSGNYTVEIRLYRTPFEEWNSTYGYWINTITQNQFSIGGFLAWLHASGFSPIFLHIVAILCAAGGAGIASKMNMPGGGIIALIILVIFTGFGWFDWHVLLLTAMTMASVMLLKGGF